MKKDRSIYHGYSVSRDAVMERLGDPELWDEEMRLLVLRTGQKSDTATKDAQKAEDDAKKAEAEKKPEDPA